MQKNDLVIAKKSRLDCQAQRNRVWVAHGTQACSSCALNSGSLRHSEIMCDTQLPVHPGGGLLPHFLSEKNKSGDQTKVPTPKGTISENSTLTMYVGIFLKIVLNSGGLRHSEIMLHSSVTF